METNCIYKYRLKGSRQWSKSVHLVAEARKNNKFFLYTGGVVIQSDSPAKGGLDEQHKLEVEETDLP